ncbi:MAG: hypothetical protein IIA59_06075 [Candidatus Marinimicrobia bacterium]|nr:hypothetical protein [Candidatus Neomarinimicrobiota bacterium]
MSLITSHPLQTFYDAMGKAPVKLIHIASPYITKPGVQLLINEFGRKRTRLQILANLSEFNIALSLANPVAPILSLMARFGDRIEIKSHPLLHAKMYLCDGRAALMGSSNLTLGGMQRNAELNWLIRGARKDGRVELSKLSTWFAERWDEASGPVTVNRLKKIEVAWEARQGQLMRVIGNLLPEPRLGGDYWSKVRKITGKKSWSIEEIGNLLTVKDDASAQNTLQKLVFLENMGLIEFDEKRATSRGVVKSQREMFELLEQGHLEVSLISVLSCIKNGKSAHMSYAQLSGKLGTPDTSVRPSVLWLESLGYLARNHTSSTDEFSLTPKIKELNLA